MKKLSAKSRKVAPKIAARALTARRGTAVLDAVAEANKRIAEFAQANPTFQAKLESQRDQPVDGAELARVLARLGIDELTAQVLQEINADPALAAYRKEGDLLRQLPELQDATLDDALAIVKKVRSHAAKKAATSKVAPAWHADAKREAARLIAAGTKQREVVGKLARMPRFSQFTRRAIQNALR